MRSFNPVFIFQSLILFKSEAVSGKDSRPLTNDPGNLSSFWLSSLSGRGRPPLQEPYACENIHPSHFMVELPLQLKAEESLSF